MKKKKDKTSEERTKEKGDNKQFTIERVQSNSHKDAHQTLKIME